MTIYMFPEIYWTWQQRMRQEFPAHWERIKDATDIDDVVTYMDWWLSTDTVSPGKPIVEICGLWLQAMDKISMGSRIILPTHNRIQ